jgi:3'-phosphoadenosine 5'-phosphosulfate synthase
VEECADIIIAELVNGGYLKGGDGLLASPDGGEVVDLLVPESERAEKEEEIRNLMPVLLRDVDVNWLQVVAEGWASPLRGFMREGVLLQTLHFNSVLMERHGFSPSADTTTITTDFDNYGAHPPVRVSMPLPIVLPCTDYTKQRIEGAKAVALTDKDGNRLAILRNPEVYEHRKEELIARSFGFIDPGHPYVKLISNAGEWLIGGEIELLKPIRYGDGLDKYRFTAKELKAKFESMGADTVFAFQTRNPTHAGHAFLMNDARRQLLEQAHRPRTSSASHTIAPSNCCVHPNRATRIPCSGSRRSAAGRRRTTCHSTSASASTSA